MTSYTLEQLVSKTVKIPVIIEDGKVKLRNGENLPLIREGATGDLIVNPLDIDNKELLRDLQKDNKVEIIPAGKSVFFAVNLNMTPRHLLQDLQEIPNLWSAGNSLFTEVKLNEPLVLRLRGSKLPRLMNCKCTIVSLDNQEATSLNHAYTLISQHYETERKSHTGNVFNGCYYKDGEKCLSIGELRNKCESEHLGNLYALKENVDNSSLIFGSSLEMGK